MAADWLLVTLTEPRFIAVGFSLAIIPTLFLPRLWDRSLKKGLETVDVLYEIVLLIVHALFSIVCALQLNFIENVPGVLQNLTCLVVLYQLCTILHFPRLWLDSLQHNFFIKDVDTTIRVVGMFLVWQIEAILLHYNPRLDEGILTLKFALIYTTAEAVLALLTVLVRLANIDQAAAAKISGLKGIRYGWASTTLVTGRLFVVVTSLTSVWLCISCALRYSVKPHSA